MQARSIVLVGVTALFAFGCEQPPKMRFERTTVTVGQDVVVTFEERLTGRATNQYWIALSPADAPLSDTTGRIILERWDRTVRLRAERPGDFEVRLHGQYPRKEHHLLIRVPVKVESLPTTAEVRPDPTREGCLDMWLGARNLDPYGSAEGTQYAGGTPLFDPTTGKAAARWDYVTSRLPEVRTACAPDDEGAR